MEDIKEDEFDELQNNLEKLLEEDSDNADENISEEIALDSREKMLSIQDISDIGPDEYSAFIDYTIAQIHNILRTQIRTKIPDNYTIKEMAQEAVSLAVVTYDLGKAIEANATIRTHLGWKAKQIVKTYARDLEKASKNELNTDDGEFKDSLEENVLKTDSSGELDQNLDVDMPELHQSQKSTYEQAKKVEWAMRQVRFELPRESNLILDIGIGEIYKFDGTPFTLPEWAKHTDQNLTYLRKIFNSSKRLVKQKLHRRGFMDIIYNEEKTSEDLLKDTKIEEHIKAQEHDENIIASTDIETVISGIDELVGDISNSESILRDCNE